jgi:hypothetical protein
MVLTAQALNAMQPVSKNGGKALYGQPGWHNVSIPINVNNKVAQRYVIRREQPMASLGLLGPVKLY